MMDNIPGNPGGTYSVLPANQLQILISASAGQASGNHLNEKARRGRFAASRFFAKLRKLTS
jgi:hypothetical protein